MTVTPIGDLRGSMPEQGRIRIGKKGPKGQPQKLHAFRFTSHDQAAIEQIAGLYGGTPTPWSDGPREGEWEVTSTSSRVPILLPPNPLGEGTPLETPIYEMWSRGGLQRRCDGETCMVSNGDALVEMPCICDTTEAMECKPKTRLIVILREIQFGGGWRIETGGYTAARELPGMVKMILNLQAKSLALGYLVLREEKLVKNNQTRKFMVPMLTTDSSPDQLLAGEGHAHALAPAPIVELEAARDAAEDTRYLARDEDDQVHDAEIVEEDEPDIAAPTPEPSSTRRSDLRSYQVNFYRICDEFAQLPELEAFSSDDARHVVCWVVSKHRTTSSKEIDETEMKVATTLMLDVLAGERRLIMDKNQFRFSAAKGSS